ncbi:MAG: aldo/keto reductase [Prochlorococcus sp.]|nr:aldo/keto reductase [Prochlorococcaceae cyanobacterium ETNP14_MAG_4]HJM80530.1 aldo/keto reductase [Prochlorococcaceae cyanobacterium Fu_MAG_72]|tara:strand:+ start:12703 stop:13839 length:1137 start_codon:yes stop_codon:yes gene_type:complete
MIAVRRRFGQGPQVSLFTLGTMRAIDSAEQMYGVVEAAQAAGINHIETAPAYGPAESFLGIALQQLQQNQAAPTGGWVITSKLLPGLTLAEGQRQLHGLLNRLGLRKLHNLAVHGVNLPEHLEWTLKGEGAALLKWAVEEDLVTQVGFSSHGAYPLIEAAITSGRFQFCSLHLHLLDPARMPLAQKALAAGMGVMAISPADKGGRLQAPSPTLVEDCSPFSPLELAYRYLLAAEISTLSIGAAQPEDLTLATQLANANNPLNKREQRAFKQLREKGEHRLGKNRCGQCRSCIPCPKSVPIPDLLRLRNLAIGHDLQAFAQERYNLIGRAGHWWESVDGNACKRCGKCLPHCPHQLPIPDLLADTHRRLAAAPRRRLWG